MASTRNADVRKRNHPPQYPGLIQHEDIEQRNRGRERDPFHKWIFFKLRAVFTIKTTFNNLPGGFSGIAPANGPGRIRDPGEKGA